ncbi:alpha/beta-hydrolase [Calocera cornea HHB12733]|uniref:Alpha/beta-hydrolase n=1 Tax=Calocera cornea HHB12733 TaxID=1353952 RepID=A0A165JUA6_9BASI|nr:alpha/beta-hydrolase [Calocera cornea HHB12733]
MSPSTSTKSAARYPLTAKLLTSADGTPIYAEAVGDPSKPSIVFVPGLALSAVVFDPLFDNARLLSKYYLVRYEPRGHARSGQPEAEEAYASARYADDFTAVVRGFALHKPIWAGWSVADIVAALGPQALTALVYISGVPSMVGAEPMRSPLLNSCVGGLLSPDAAGQAAAARTFVDACFDRPDAVSYAMRMAMLGSTFTQSATARLRVLMRQQDPAPLFRAAQAGLPLLFVTGDRDKAVVAPEVVKVLRANFKRLMLREVKGAGHTCFVEDTHAFVDALVEFADMVC